MIIIFVLLLIISNNFIIKLNWGIIKRDYRLNYYSMSKIIPIVIKNDIDIKIININNNVNNNNIDNTIIFDDFNVIINRIVMHHHLKYVDLNIQNQQN